MDSLLNKGQAMQKVDNTALQSIRGLTFSSLSYWDIIRFNQFGFGNAELPDATFVLEAFEKYVRQTPYATAVTNGEESLSYSQLNDLADCVACELMHRGIGKGDHIGLFVERSMYLLVGILASLKIGATYIPQDVKKAPASFLEKIVNIANPKVVLTTRSSDVQLPQFETAETHNIETLIARGARHLSNFSPIPKVSEHDNCFILFTSGTTGTPNGVCVSHKNLSNIIMTQPGDLGIKPGMTVSQLLCISFDMSAWEIFGALCHGATLLLRGSDFQETASKANVIIATPSILGRIDPALCPDVKTVAVAGEPCPRPLADKWSHYSNFYNCCGPTETTIVNTMQLHNAKHRLTIGKPTPNNTVYILDENMQPCEIGEVGEMWAGGACVTNGYLKNQTLTAERYVRDPFMADGSLMFRTRDLGRWTEDGELEHLGRTDDQVKVRGFRVELDGVSKQLESIQGIDLAVTLKLDERTLISFVSPEKCSEEEGKRFLEDRLPYYSIPEHIIAMPELPLTPRGKIDKRKLMQQFLDSIASGTHSEGVA